MSCWKCDSLHSLGWAHRDLGSNRLTGVLPVSSILPMTNLQYLDFSKNLFTGAMPPQYGMLTSLTHISLSSNKLTATKRLPPEYGQLTQLRYLNLSNTYIQKEAPMPPEYSALINLQELRLTGLLLGGPIPPEYAVLPLTGIFLDYNNLTGPIPLFLCNMKGLINIYLSSNNLTGPIQPCLGDLPNLQFLWLRNNPLGGSIPDSLGNLAGLIELNVDYNNLTGPLPLSFAKCTQMVLLHICCQALTGPYPDEWLAFSNLTILTMGYNYLGATGSRIPSTLNYSNLRQGIFNGLYYLDLSYNQYVGPIPTNLKTLPLTTIDLAGNSLTGTIPPFNPAIVNLYLNNNRFIGRLTNDWLNYTNLRDVDLSFNSISGPINVIGGTTIPPALKFLRLHNNLFTGRIPDQFGRFPSLTALYLNDNSMLGPIPDSFTNFTDMRFLRLNNNNLSGSIIPGLGKLNNHIKTLDLSYNSFTGPFPIKIVSYVLPQALSYIDISYNFFNASYPVNRIFAPGISYADFNHNCFTNATVIKGSNASATFVAGQRSLEECQEHQKGVAEPILTYPNRLGLRGLDQASETASFNYRYGSVLPPPMMDHRSAQPPTVPPIKNQLDSCDSCWAFSATAAVSSLVAIATGVLPDLSEQQLLDCTVNKAGCTGGWPASAIDYIAKNSIATEDQYPYDGRNETCLLPTGAGIRQTARVAGWESVPAEDAFSLMQAVSMQPIIVGIQADQNDIQAYINGTFSGVCGEDLNHAVVVVGYDTTVAVPVWFVRNSWGATWGEGGYIRLPMVAGTGLCGMMRSTPIYPVLMPGGIANPCRPNPCGRGNCTANGTLGYSCACPPGYISTTNNTVTGLPTCVLAVCTTDPCLCKTNPCGANGMCESNGFGGMDCRCPTGYTSVPSPVTGIASCQTENPCARYYLVGSDPQVGTSCASIVARFQIPLSSFTTLNPLADCSRPLPSNTTVCVQPTTAADGDDLQCPESGVYVVEDGDTCHTLLLSNNLTLLDFRLLNPGKLCNLIASKQEICLQYPEAVTESGFTPYYVTAGDTLSGVVQQFVAQCGTAVTAAAILYLNDIFNPALLVPGSVLLIPCRPPQGINCATCQPGPLDSYLCAANGVTYSSACQVTCNHADPWYYGRCDSCVFACRGKCFGGFPDPGFRYCSTYPYCPYPKYRDINYCAACCWGTTGDFNGITSFTLCIGACMATS
eukprot:SM000281S10751  [mRNA]  locus=s281:42191:53518:- [translate_table: standard]